MRSKEVNMESTSYTTNYETARFNMIEQQIRTWEVLDPVVLQLLNDTPREFFVPEAYQGLAFADLEIPIGCEQKMLSPKLEARIVQALNLRKTDRVLHVGTGTGYLTALLAKLTQHVISVEIYPELSHQAAQNLQVNHIHNVDLKVGDAAYGWPMEAPYDAIVFGASSPVEPSGVREQLAIGGRMLIVLGKAPAMHATLIQRISENGFREDVLFETCIDPLINAEQGKQFTF
jgi:protein-L-isoaspartate(D-aspartate) O-methyltransferase